MTENRTEIYFGASIRGGRDDQEIYFQIISMLGEYGIVLTEHIGKKDLTVMGEQQLSDSEIYTRDMEWLRRSTKRVFELTNPSTGVGYEVREAENYPGSTLCLSRTVEGKKLSAMINGNPNVQVVVYESVEDLKPAFDEFFRKG